MNWFGKKKKEEQDANKPVDSYYPPIALVYIFNLIVGVGALSMPIAFSQAGYVIGSVLICVLCALSYVTATFVIEAMAAANALLRRRKLTASKSTLQKNDLGDSSSSSVTESEEIPLLTGKEAADMFEITVKVEMAEMATMFFHKVGLVLYYVCKCLYLYGDLAIYAIAVPKSVQYTVCPPPRVAGNASNSTGNASNFSSTGWHGGLGSSVDDNDVICAGPLTKQQIYYISLAAFIVLLGPFTFFNLQRTKFLQIATSILRNAAFIMMVVLALVGIARGDHREETRPVWASPGGVPALFGISIYSFMCHHSLPGMITPMTTKRHIFKLLFLDYIGVVVIYLALAYTAVFWLPSTGVYAIQDLYTINFFGRDSFIPVVISYYLILFPVFTLSTNFPIISVTLRETIKALFHSLRKGKKYPFVVEYIVFPLMAIVPPFALAFATQNEELMVAITGSIPGVGVQYVIPVFLAVMAKRTVNKELGHNQYHNKHKSIFNNIVCVVGVLVWAFVCVVLVIIYQVLKATGVYS